MIVDSRVDVPLRTNCFGPNHVRWQRKVWLKLTITLQCI